MPQKGGDIPSLIKSLHQNNMAGFHVRDKKELLSLLRTFIADGTTVGCGDSVTLEQTGVFDDLRKREIYLKNFSADTFVTGANAVTMDGKIFNIDGNGSRVAPMLYGPKQVIVVVGTNKITEDAQAAVKRARQIAAPLDAKRLNKATPCTALDRCIDCRHKERICNDFVLIAGQFVKERIKVIIVNEELGY